MDTHHSVKIYIPWHLCASCSVDFLLVLIEHMKEGLGGGGTGFDV